MKVLLILACGVVGFVIAVGVAGLFLPATRSTTGTREIAAPAGRVWTLLTDFRAQPSWRQEIATVEVLDSEPGRERWIERPRRGPAIHFRTERQQAPFEWIVAFDGPATGQWTGRLEELPDGRVRVQVKEVATVSNPWMRVLARLAFDPQAFVDRYLADLARAAERESP
mgnify:CR=1 FL=1